MNLKKVRSELILAAIITIFGVIYGLISLVNHYLYRTYALDLGMFNQAMYCFSHFKMNYFTLDVKAHEISYFGDHFSPITILLSPLYYLFGSYTLLLVQIFFILYGGVGIYKFVCFQHKKPSLSLILVLQFFCIWGIYFALSSDYHNNVIAAMMVPWLLYYYVKKNHKGFIIFFFLILITKENMALWLGFIMLGLIIKNLRRHHLKADLKQILKFEFPYMMVSFLYFIIVVSVVMPYLNPIQEINPVNRYDHLGGSIYQIFLNIINNPRYIFSLLFESPLLTESSFGAKSELHFMVLVSGGFALIYRPYYLIMLIPVYFQKLLTLSPSLWGVNAQYSIEFVPILTIALSDFLLKFKSAKVRYLIAAITTVSTIWFTYGVLESNKIVWYNKTNTAFYEKAHYETTLNVKEINTVLKSIPDKVPVSVNATVAPHLANRERLYHFPVVKEAKYIVLMLDNYYPLTGEEFFNKINECTEKENFRIKYAENGLLILKKD